MKKINVFFIVIILFCSSCSIHNGLTRNFNHQTTEVNLSKKNFKMVEREQGEAKARYILGIGGLSKKAMIEEARADMLSKAEILGGARTIINERVEILHTFFPIVRLYTVTVSGHIIEFTE